MSDHNRRATDTTNMEVVTTGTLKALDEKDIEIQRLKEMVAMGRRVVEDFLPNIGQCALQNYGELNEFMIQSAALENKDNEVIVVDEIIGTSAYIDGELQPKKEGATYVAKD